MVESENLNKMVADLLSEQLFAVLSTRSEDELHSALVAFASSEDIREIVFVTPRQTRKFENILTHKHVSLFVDNRKNNINDLQRLIGVEARGEVSVMDGEGRMEYQNLFLSKFPQFNSFVESPNSAIIKIEVQRYDVVHHFQNVTVLEMR